MSILEGLEFYKVSIKSSWELEFFCYTSYFESHFFEIPLNLRISLS